MPAGFRPQAKEVRILAQRLAVAGETEWYTVTVRMAANDKRSFRKAGMSTHVRARAERIFFPTQRAVVVTFLWTNRGREEVPGKPLERRGSKDIILDGEEPR